MILFARVVEAGSFAAAARDLGQTRAAVSRQISGLEARVGAQLLNRTKRRMHLTEIGREFYERCRRVAAEVDAAERDVANMQGAVRGELRVSAPVTFGRLYIAPLLAEFLQKHDEMTIDLALHDDPPPLLSAEFDVGVRIAALADSTLVARKLTESPHAVCAAPGYWRRHVEPKSPEELREHNCLLYSPLQNPSLWRFRNGKSVRVRGNLSVDHGESLRQAVIDGLGVAYLPTFLVADDLARGDLVSVLEPFAYSRQNVYALYPRNRHLTPKVRAFVDLLVERFQPLPPWSQARA